MNCITALTAIGVDHGADQGGIDGVPHLHNDQQQGVPQIQASELGSEDGHGGPVAPGSLPQHPPANGADHRPSAFPSAVFTPKASINEPTASLLRSAAFLYKSPMEKSHEIFLL